MPRRLERLWPRPRRPRGPARAGCARCRCSCGRAGALPPAPARSTWRARSVKRSNTPLSVGRPDPLHPAAEPGAPRGVGTRNGAGDRGRRGRRAGHPHAARGRRRVRRPRAPLRGHRGAGGVRRVRLRRRPKMRPRRDSSVHSARCAEVRPRVARSGPGCSASSSTSRRTACGPSTVTCCCRCEHPHRRQPTTPGSTRCARRVAASGVGSARSIRLPGARPRR